MQPCDFPKFSPNCFHGGRQGDTRKGGTLVFSLMFKDLMIANSSLPIKKAQLTAVRVRMVLWIIKTWLTETPKLTVANRGHFSGLPPVVLFACYVKKECLWVQGASPHSLHVELGLRSGEHAFQEERKKETAKLPFAVPPFPAWSSAVLIGCSILSMLRSCQGRCMEP